MIIGGLDPGNSGAVAAYDSDAKALVLVQDLPHYKVIISGHERYRVDEDALYDIFTMLKQTFDMKLLCIEQVMGMPKQSAPSAFQFGFTYGMIRTTARYAGLQIHDCAPTVWKLQMRVPKVPDAISKKAENDFPAYDKATWWGPGKKLKGGKRSQGAALHDRAEAAFLAQYGAEKIWPALQPREKLRKAVRQLKKAA